VFLFPCQFRRKIICLPRQHSPILKARSTNSNYEKYSSVVLRIGVGRLRDGAVALVLLLQLFATDATTGFQ
jgi:hypothetical protein